MYVIAVTGGMGSGKSFACDFLASRGAIVLSLDEIAHAALEPGSIAYDRVLMEYGPEILNGDARIDRGALATIVFADEAALARLNRIVHPVVLKEVVEGITSLRLMERPPQVVVLEIPLLVEAPVFADVADTVLAIEAPAEERLRRAIDAGMDPLDASRRITRQATDNERSALAEHAIINDGTLEEFRERLEAYWDDVAPNDA